ncbi:MAG: hypothetical protein CM1200mP18_09340 [Gammaproteobacteria bacterium]|nr:MAG: hypothetical protein CM1200mP18_09340 [Gammaproteobacteria bacterium]
MVKHPVNLPPAASTAFLHRIAPVHHIAMYTKLVRTEHSDGSFLSVIQLSLLVNALLYLSTQLLSFFQVNT